MLEPLPPSIAHPSPARSPRRARLGARFGAALRVLALSVGSLCGCLLDSSEVCGPHQHEGSAGTCECDAGFAADEARICRKQKSSPEALGRACDAKDAPCEDPKYAHCRVATGSGGYCTNEGCESTDDCDGDFYCDTGAEPSYCRRPPTGQGEPCESSADCDGFEADYCLVNPVQSSCLVRDCETDADCMPQWTCSDYSAALPGTPTVCSPTNPM